MEAEASGCRNLTTFHGSKEFSQLFLKVAARFDFLHPRPNGRVQCLHGHMDEPRHRHPIEVEQEIHVCWLASVLETELAIGYHSAVVRSSVAIPTRSFRVVSQAVQTHVAYVAGRSDYDLRHMLSILFLNYYETGAHLVPSFLNKRQDVVGETALPLLFHASELAHKGLQLGREGEEHGSNTLFGLRYV